MTTDAALTRAALHILLSLADGPRHGLGIADEAERLTDGAVSLGPGTLYRSLQGLEDAGLVTPAAAPDGQADPRRKFYDNTAAGRQALREGVGLHVRVVEAARRKGVLPEGA